MNTLSFKQSFIKANQQFMDILQGDVALKLGGRFEIVEGITAENMAKILDTLGGIDAWHIRDEKGIRGIALRVQTAIRSWRTFTVRKSRESGAKTEYEKRKYAIENDYLYPYLTFQAYINFENEPLEWAIAKTSDIIRMIESGHCIVRKTGPSQKGQAEFYVVNWDDMIKNGCKIVIRNMVCNN